MAICRNVFPAFFLFLSFYGRKRVLQFHVHFRIFNPPKEMQACKKLVINDLFPIEIFTCCNTMYIFAL